MTWLQWSRWLACFALALNLTGCGAQGEGRGKRPALPSPPPDPDPNLGLTTSVELMGHAPTRPTLRSCLSVGSQPGLATLDTWQIDGDLGEIEDEARQFQDPLADAPRGFDLGHGTLARAGAGFYLGLTSDLQPGTPWVFEVGGMVQRGNRLDRELRRVFRVTADGSGGAVLERYQESAWQQLAVERYLAAEGAGAFEIWLHEDLLGDATAYPVFWLRAHVPHQDANRVEPLDVVAPVVFPSTLGGSQPIRLKGGCQEWTGQTHALRVVHLASSSVRPDVAEYAFQHVRYALDRLGELDKNQQWSLNQLVVLLTNSEVSSAVGGVGPAHAKSPGSHQPLVLRVSSLNPGTKLEVPEGRLLRSIATQVADQFLYASGPQAPLWLRRIVAAALVNTIEQQAFGLPFWLSQSYRQVERFRVTPDQDDPRPLALMSEPELNGGWASDKIEAYGQRLATQWSRVDLYRFWQEAAAAADGSGAVLAWQDVLTAALEANPDRRPIGQPRPGEPPPPLEPVHPERWLNGWISDQPYVADFGADLVTDADLDGLQKYWEQWFGTAPDKADTDGDGWNDYAEGVAGSDPLAWTKSPLGLVLDGQFDDWLTLLPQRVLPDIGVSGNCDEAADITHFGAILTAEDLMVGANAANFATADASARWELVLDVPSLDYQRQLTMRSGSRGYELRAIDGVVQRVFERAPVLGHSAAEWHVSRQDLGLDKYLDEIEGIQFKLRTVTQRAGEDVFCDETDWFAPLISR